MSRLKIGFMLIVLGIFSLATPLRAFDTEKLDLGLQLLLIANLDDSDQSGVSIEPWLRYRFTTHLENYLVSGLSIYGLGGDAKRYYQIPVYDLLKFYPFRSKLLSPHLEAGPGVFKTFGNGYDDLSFGCIGGGGLELFPGYSLSLDLSVHYRLYDVTDSDTAFIFYGITLGIR